MSEDAAGGVAVSSSAALPRGSERLEAFLSALPQRPTIVEHAAVFTVEEANAIDREIPGQHTKNLFLKDKKGSLFLVTAAADAAVDLKSIHTLIGAKGRVSFGSAERLSEALGVAPGSVTPLALVNDDAGRVAFALDRTVAEAEFVNVHPLRNTATITLRQADLRAFLDHVHHPPTIIDLSATA